MSCETIFPALLHDPIVIWSGLSIFSASLFAIPVFYEKIPEVIILIFGSALYTLITCADYIFPARNELTHRHNRREIREDRLYLTLRMIGRLLSHPMRIITTLRNDLNCRGSSAATIIRYKFKCVFICMSTVVVAMGLFNPFFANISGFSAILNFLISAGLDQAVSQYGTSFIVGAAVYSTRTFIIGLGLLICKISRCCGNSMRADNEQPPDDSPPPSTIPRHHGPGLRRSRSADFLLFSDQPRRQDSDIHQVRQPRQSSRSDYSRHNLSPTLFGANPVLTQPKENSKEFEHEHHKIYS